MKLGTPFFILLTVVFVLTSVAIIINGFSETYPEAGVAQSTLESRYTFFSDINNSFEDIKISAENVGNKEGFLYKIFTGGYVLLLAVVTTFTSLIGSIPLFGLLLVDIGSSLSVPPAITIIGFVAIIGSIVIMIVKFYHRGG